MITRLPAHYGDPTCASAVVAGGFVFLAHHTGDLALPGLADQTRTCLDAVRRTLEDVGAPLSSLVQVTLWVRELPSDEVREAWDVFGEVLGDQPPARMTATTGFFDPRCRVMVDGVAYLGEAPVRTAR